MRSQKNLGTLSISKSLKDKNVKSMHGRHWLDSVRSSSHTFSRYICIFIVITMPAALIYATYLIDLSRFQDVEDLCIRSCEADVRPKTPRIKERRISFAVTNYLSECKMGCESKLSSGRQISRWTQLMAIGIWTWFGICVVVAFLIRQRL